MDVCPRVSVLCCPVSVEALRRVYPPSKESYQNFSICRSRKPIMLGQGPRRTVSAFKKNYAYISHLSHMCHMRKHLLLCPRVDLPHSLITFGKRVQIMKLLIMQFFSNPLLFLPA
jgi:hypothetical protein